MYEMLAMVFIALVFIGVALAICYLWILMRFFRELRRKEPQVWRDIGSPTLANMLLLPFVRIRKFYAFLPIAKARRYDNGYDYASRVCVLLHIGLAYTVAIMCFAVLMGMYVMVKGG